MCILKKCCLLIVMGFLSWSAELTRAETNTIRFTQNRIQIDGQYRLLRGGSLQWFRMPEEVWEDRMIRFKKAGFNAIGMYIAWNQIEPREGEFNFTSPNIRKFFELAKKHDLWVMVRPGPYITNEMDGGGLPAWLTRNATKKSLKTDGQPNLRTHDRDFIEPVRRYLTTLNEVLKPYLVTQGGPIILYVIENEYNWFERSVKIDHLFWYEGGMERPWNAVPSTKKYITALRNIVEESGIDIPIIACPGDGKISALGDVPRVYPFPNIYEWATPDQPDEAAWKILSSMHSEKHGGIYRDAPSGSLEVNRSPQEFRRMIMGGLDAVFAFNVVGMAQEGLMNAILLGARAGDVPPHWGVEDEKPQDWVDTIFQFNWDSFINGFIEPKFGYFGGVVDYKGAISPSGVINDSWFQFRRDNFFYNWLEQEIASSGRGIRTQGRWSDFYVEQKNLGSRESKKKAFYRLDFPGGGHLLSIVNQSGKVQEIPLGGIHFKEQRFPRYIPMLVPVAEEVRPTYTSLLLNQFSLSEDFFIDYSTIEILEARTWQDTTLLSIYGVHGSAGEIALKGEGPFTIESSQSDLQEGLILGVSFSEADVISIQDRNGKQLSVIVTNRKLAGRLWFDKDIDPRFVFVGLDYLQQSGLNAGTSSIEAYHDNRRQYYFRLNLAETFSKAIGYSDFGNVGFSRVPLPSIEEPIAMPAINVGQARKDPDLLKLHSEGWLQATPGMRWQGEPEALEWFDIYGGFAWYHSFFEVDETGDPSWDELYIHSASDIIGIYVNSHYLTTVLPMGTEIHNQSKSQRYRFPSLRPFLKKGKNVISFKTEVWGHGSFMFGRGSILGSRGRYPALSYESLKGLYGEAKIGKKKLDNWLLIPKTTGQRRQFYSEDYPISGWEHAEFPMSLEKGDVLWYRTDFDSGETLLDDVFAPIVLSITGRSAKATIYLNDRLIGRWLSDNEWINQGVWGRAERGLWVDLDPDHFPLMEQVLKPGRNRITLLIEDTSSWDQPAGELYNLALKVNREARRTESNELFHGIRYRHRINL